MWQISGIRWVEVKSFQIRQTVGNRKSFAGTSGRGYYLPASSAGIAQLVEQLICNQQVIGSNPIAGSLNAKDLRKIREGKPKCLCIAYAFIRVQVCYLWPARLLEVSFAFGQ